MLKLDFITQNRVHGTNLNPNPSSGRQFRGFPGARPPWDLGPLAGDPPIELPKAPSLPVRLAVEGGGFISMLGASGKTRDTVGCWAAQATPRLSGGARICPHNQFCGRHTGFTFGNPREGSACAMALAQATASAQAVAPAQGGALGGSMHSESSASSASVPRLRSDPVSWREAVLILPPKKAVWSMFGDFVVTEAVPDHAHETQASLGLPGGALDQGFRASYQPTIRAHQKRDGIGRENQSLEAGSAPGQDRPHESVRQGDTPEAMGSVGDQRCANAIAQGISAVRLGEVGAV